MLMGLPSVSHLKGIVRAVLPDTLRHKISLIRVDRSRRADLDKTTQQVFTDIYVKNVWGGNTGEFYSGSGSETHLAEPYIRLVQFFIQEHGIRTVVDLGCGDFRIGRHIAEVAQTYIGVDIVDALVERNCKEFGKKGVDFLCLDIVNDELPKGDLCLIRQVLQHLSNEQICAILPKIRQYRYTLVTEHYPTPSSTIVPNVDKPHGPDTRLLDNSAVYLDLPPFNVQGVETLLQVDDPQCLIADGQTIRTMLIHGFEQD